MMSSFLEEFVVNDENAHIAASIVAQWQNEFHKSWKWNNSHRHSSSGKRVPIWDDSSRTYTWAISPPLPFIIPAAFIDKQERLSIYRIRLIRYNMRLRESKRQKQKRVWWLHNVESRSKYARELAFYKRERMVPGLWLSLAMDHGLTFRHLRTSGYKPYIDTSDDLYEISLGIDALVREEVRILGEPPMNIYRPYLIHI